RKPGLAHFARSLRQRALHREITWAPKSFFSLTISGNGARSPSIEKTDSVIIKCAPHSFFGAPIQDGCSVCRDDCGEKRAGSLRSISRRRSATRDTTCRE